MNKITFLLLLSFTTLPALAADEGFYVGANVTHTKAYVESTGSTLDFDSPTAFAVQLGYQLNKHLAFEAQYGDFGNIAPIATWEISGYSVAAVGILPFGEDWSVYGKLGYASTDSKLTGASILDGTYNKKAATYGIGGQFSFDESLGMRFGVDRYSTGGETGAFLLNDGHVTVFYVGVKYLFN